jgi:putative flippase GtrA
MKLIDVLRRPEMRFVRFLLVGAVNTAFGYGVFALLVTAGLHYAAAALLSTIMGILFNFISTGTLVFGKRDARLFPRFLAVYGICYAAGVIALTVADRAHVDVRLAGAALAIPQALLAYVLQKVLVFGGARSGRSEASTR